MAAMAMGYVEKEHILLVWEHGRNVGCGVQQFETCCYCFFLLFHRQYAENMRLKLSLRFGITTNFYSPSVILSCN